MSPAPRLVLRGPAALTTTLATLGDELRELGFTVAAEGTEITLVEDPRQVSFARAVISPRHPLSLIEQALRCLPIDVDQLAPFVEGESKAIHKLTEQVLIESLKPTVYSYTHNRYGVVEGTGETRARFSAEVFRRMAALPTTPAVPRSAFLGLIETARGPAIAQRRVVDSNLEARVKRYHIGSPLHRYRYTERYPTTQSCGALRRWSRFDTPVVCFDWRHPLLDDEGNRLADEPISDDYAAVWIADMPHAKEMARNTFLWLESMMAAVDLVLIDMCMFIDRSGRWIFGEISPDCMRVRSRVDELDAATAFDKDVWRSGAPGRTVAERYQEMYERLFGSDPATGEDAVAAGSEIRVRG